MLHNKPSPNLPLTLIREFKKWARSDWRVGVGFPDLLDRVNQVAQCFAPEKNRKGSAESRVKRIFTERSFRHYQTLGCIEAPEKQGKTALYGFRHFLQALLVRRLLHERLPTEQIALLLVDRNIVELERMLLRGVEMVPKIAGHDPVSIEKASELMETWERVRLATGIELHIQTNIAQLKPTELKKVMAQVEKELSKLGC